MKPLFLVLLCISGTAPCGAQEICVRRVVVPGYPHLARVASLQGTVTVQFEFSAEGKVLSAKGSGAHKLLVRTSEENIRQWTFAPVNVTGGSPSKRTITYVYRLEGKGLYIDPPPTVILDLPDRVEITTHPSQLQTATPKVLK